tara:strand:- start:6713 stop:7663 length:951 start_codon:yes stop_codon:yes gene_type:complete
MNIHQKRIAIATYLSEGQSAAEIARKLNVSESYISQLREDDQFKVLEAQMAGSISTEATVAAVSYDARLDQFQEEILSAIEAGIGMFTKPKDALDLFKTIDSAKRRGKVDSLGGNTQVTVLELPAFLINQSKPQIKDVVTADNQIIEVDGRALVSQTSDSLLETVSSREATRLDAYNSATTGAIDTAIDTPTPTTPNTNPVSDNPTDLISEALDDANDPTKFDTPLNKLSSRDAVKRAINVIEAREATAIKLEKKASIRFNTAVVKASASADNNDSSKTPTRISIAAQPEAKISEEGSVFDMPSLRNNDFNEDEIF